jgi:cytosol alanyl aminopeptidase
MMFAPRLQSNLAGALNQQLIVCMNCAMILWQSLFLMLLTSASAGENLRLANDIKPLGYKLQLQIDPAKENFSGEVQIDIDWPSAEKEIVLHGQDLLIKDAYANTLTGETWKLKVVPVENSGHIKLISERPMQPQVLQIHIVYEAAYNKKLEGLYRLESQNHWYAFTQFEPISARLMFPCFDEPGFKTPFEISVVIPEDLAAVGNTPIEHSSTVTQGFKTVHFAKTQPLPTYLVALAIGPFDIVAGKDIPPNNVRKTPLPLRGVATAGSGPRLQYALAHTGELVEKLEQYFGVPYPFEKLDIIAVPDFTAGAMENAGAITFRDWLLLIEENAPVEQKRSFADVMAHELAHQWFGDLVTMAWWDDLWLNEAFATWLGNKTVNSWNRSYKADQWLQEDMLAAMTSDSLSSARQIREPIVSENDIANAFDDITYSKGGGVLSMFESYLGESRFRSGVQHHLQKFAFKTATADDFIASESESTLTSLDASFKSFLLQPGVPVVNAAVDCVGQGKEEHASVTLTQSRYVPLGSTLDKNKTWQIPVCLRTGASKKKPGKDEKQCFLLKDKEQTFALKSCPAWVFPNADGAGYYRYTLPHDKQSQFYTADILTNLTPREQLAAFDSLKAAWESGLIETADMLTVLPFFARSKERKVAEAPLPYLRWLARHVVKQSHQVRFAKYVRDLYAPNWERLKKLNDDDSALFKQALAGFLIEIGKDRQLTDEYAKIGKSYLEDPTQNGDTNMRGVAIAAALERSDKMLFDVAVMRLKTTQDAAFRRSLVRALGSIENAKLASAVRDLVSEPQLLRSNEIFMLLGKQMDRVEKQSTWDWLRDHFAMVTEKTPLFQQGELPMLASHFCTAEKAKEVAKFFGSRVEKLPGGPRNLSAAVERVQLCHVQVERHQTNLQKFLSKPGVAKRKTRMNLTAR